MRLDGPEDVLRARLATQRLSGPAAASPVQVVRELLCVQAQDAPLAQAMIALRCQAGEADVRAAIGRGEIVRTHVLRPTWHYVAADDLRWLLALTSPKVESGMAARHRQLGLDEPLIVRGLDAIANALAGHSYADRRHLGTILADAGVLTAGQPLFGQQVGHLLMLAELRALICSAPSALAAHRYALVDEVVPVTADRDRGQAIDEIVGRFVAGHGPVALSDLVRWAKVTLAEARTAVDRLAAQVRTIDVGGQQLWYSPAAVLPETRNQDAWLLSTFDEAFLSYRTLPWPRSATHPAGSDPYRFAEVGGGVVIHRLTDVGAWKRTRRRGLAELSLDVDPRLSGSARQAIDRASRQLLAAIGSA
jgi:hypothetical protein